MACGVGGVGGGEARPVSGGRGSCASACCALRHGGSAIARLPSPPAASASMRFRFGLALRFRKPAALPRGLVASVRSARSSRSSARVRVPPPDAWLASAGRMRRDAVVSRRPALASAAPCAAGGVRAPSRSSRTVRSTAPGSAHIQSQDIHEITVRMKSSPSPARTNILFRI